MSAVESTALGLNQERSVKGFLRFAESLGLEISFQDVQPISSKAIAMAVFTEIPGIESIKTNDEFDNSTDWFSLSILGELTNEYLAMKDFVNLLPNSRIKRTGTLHLRGFENAVKLEFAQVANGQQVYVSERFESISHLD